MYSIKQNQLIMGALPLADVTVYYMDMRAVGKGYNEFYEQAKGMGANFVKGRVAEHHREGERQPGPPLRGHRERHPEPRPSTTWWCWRWASGPTTSGAGCSPTASWGWTTTPMWASRRRT